jgi:hypothetical protein
MEDATSHGSEPAVPTDFQPLIDHFKSGGELGSAPLIEDLFRDIERVSRNLIHKKCPGENTHWVDECCQRHLTKTIEKLTRATFWEKFDPAEGSLISYLAFPVTFVIKQILREENREDLIGSTEMDLNQVPRREISESLQEVIDNLEFAEIRPEKPSTIISSCLIAFLGRRLVDRDRTTLFPQYLQAIRISDSDVLDRHHLLLTELHEKLATNEERIDRVFGLILAQEAEGIGEFPSAFEEEKYQGLNPTQIDNRDRAYRLFPKKINRLERLKQLAKSLSVSLLFPLNREIIQEIFGVTRATAWKRRERSQVKLFFYFTTGNQALDQRISRVIEKFDHTEDFSDIDEEEEE